MNKMPKRILYIWDADYPWDVRVEKICTTLARNGYMVHIAARNLKRYPEYEIENGLIIHRIKTWKNETMNYFLSFPAFFSPIWKRFLDRIIKENNIGLIIVRDLPMAIAGIWAGNRHRVPVLFDMAEDYVAMIWDIWRVRKFRGLNFLVRNPHLAKLVERYVLKKSEHIFVVVEEAKDLVVKRGVSPGKVTIIGNTLPLEFFDVSRSVPSAILDKIRDRYSAIYTGGIQMGRGIQVVFDAIPEIIKDIPDFLFVIVGDGYATDILKKMMLDKNVQDHVLWVGWMEHNKIFDYIRSCKLGIIPHFVTDHVNTTIPNKIFEYMGFGLPVVASDAEPMKRILDEEGCGVTFKSGDIKDLTRAIIKVKKSENLLGKCGIRAVQDKYNWGEDTKRLLLVIERHIKKIQDRVISKDY